MPKNQKQSKGKQVFEQEREAYFAGLKESPINFARRWPRRHPATIYRQRDRNESQFNAWQDILRKALWLSMALAIAAAIIWGITNSN